MAILEDDEGDIYQFCGGTLIAENWVLSAAHCFDDDTDVSLISVAAGIVELSARTEGDTIEVKRIIDHENYDEDTLDNDIALLELKTSYDLSTSNLAAVPWITATTADLANEGSMAKVSGWGNMDDSGEDDNAEFPDILQWVKLDIVSCTDGADYPSNQITENMMCAGVESYTKDACQGDSGGPLVVQNTDDDKWHLAGVVSWGDGCASDGYPGVYARVSQYDNWINDKMGLSTASKSSGSTSSGSLEHPISWLLLLVLAAIGYRARVKASAAREQI